MKGYLLGYSMFLRLFARLVMRQLYNIEACCFTVQCMVISNPGHFHFTKTSVLFYPQWLPWLHTSWGFERFTLVQKSNCIRQPERQLSSSSYNHNMLMTLRTSVKESLQMHFKIAVRNLHALNAGDSLTGVLRVVSVLWL